MLWCNVVKRNWTIILVQTVLDPFYKGCFGVDNQKLSFTNEGGLLQAHWER